MRQISHFPSNKKSKKGEGLFLGRICIGTILKYPSEGESNLKLLNLTSCNQLRGL